MITVCAMVFKGIKKIQKCYFKVRDDQKLHDLYSEP